MEVAGQGPQVARLDLRWQSQSASCGRAAVLRLPSVTTQASRFALRLLVGIGLLLLVVQFVDVGDALRAVRNLQGSWLAASIACYVATRVLMAVKWWVLLGASKAGISYSTVQRALCLSDYYSLVFPNTLAVDVTRVFLLRHHRGGTGFMTAAILADRVINVATTGATSLIALAVTYAVSGAWPFSPAVAYAVLGVALLVVAAAITVASRRVTTLSTQWLRSVHRTFPRLARLPGWIETAARVHAAMSTMLTRPGTLLPAIGLAVAMVLARV
ncbi:MAG: lysylphosphatidylglycerol synthase domain-containing protein, partial [Burkholderiaceae bacterium]